MQAPKNYTVNDIRSVRLVVGLEVHVELGTRTKMFSRAASPAYAGFEGGAPNTLIDPTVLALPGALPVMNKAAVEMSVMVGMALGCQIAEVTKWDRKSYFYPDLPKAYQISQYDLPVCFDGAVDVPGVDEKGQMDFESEPRRIGILRAHLEEDAGKLMHEAPGGFAIEYSIADYNRAGTPLLEIVTQPDFDSAERVVVFCRMLRNICRFLGVSEGVMQKGHIRFEPNINCHLTLSDGLLVKTPIVEVKNLNSFKSVKGAIEHEFAEQPGRWLRERREFGPGTKQTRGWDESANGGRGATVLQREKEDAHEYRYFPDPDLVPVVIDEDWKGRIAARVPELPLARLRRYVDDFGMGLKEAAALTEERDVCFFYEACLAEMEARKMDRGRAAKVAANFVLQNGQKRANERGCLVNELGISPGQVATIAWLREEGKLSSNGADEVFGLCCEEGRGHADVEAVAKERGLLLVRDDAALAGWIAKAIEENAQAAADVRAGKQAAVGRLVGAVVKLAGGSVDAKVAREELMKKLM